MSRENMSREEREFIAKRYGDEINKILERMATLLYNDDVSLEVSGEVGGLAGELSRITFKAGVEFSKQRELSGRGPG